VLPSGPTTTTYYVVASIPNNNYQGESFAAELQKLINEDVKAKTRTDLKYEVAFDQNDNLISITQTVPFNIAKTRIISVADLRLQDSYGNIVNLRNNHFSFSLVFSEKYIGSSEKRFAPNKNIYRS
jgi:hypothetical protein